MPSATALTKPVLPPLQTPKSASFPSEIVSTPMSAVMSAVIKQEQDLKTPITPPTAYTDFIKALTPIMASPPHSALNRSNSDDSTTSQSSKSSFASQNGEIRSPASATLPPPTPMSAGYNAGRNTPTTLKRLRIPQYSPVSAFSPATSRSPYTALNSAMLYSPFSPADWTGRSSCDFITTPRSACSKPVSVRSVVTRTVTYKRTTPNLEPAPKGKKRKVSSSASSIVSVDDLKRNLKETKRDVQPESNLKAETKQAEVKLEIDPKVIVESVSEHIKQEMPPPPTIALSPATTTSSSAEP